jgi:hypothetical protein
MTKAPQNKINSLIEECLLAIMVEDAIKAREAALGLCEAVEAGPADTSDIAGVVLGTFTAITCASMWFLVLAALMGKIA